jgi:hypothetical protein
MTTSIFWADGKTQSAIQTNADTDLEIIAGDLGCEVDQVNQCAPGEMDAYGVSLKTDIFQRPKGLAN